MKAVKTWPVNEDGHVILTTGSGSATVHGYVLEDFIPVDEDGRMPVVFDVSPSGSGGSVTSNDISDASATGKSVLTGTQSQGRTALGLSTVAATGAYSDLSGKPTLGTAAATASSDYATAAQGVKADAAIPATEKGAVNGVATLGSDGKVPTSQLPATAPAVSVAAPVIIFDGDSKTGEPAVGAQFVDSTEFLEFYIGAQIGVGGSNSGSSSTTNLTSTARLASTATTVSTAVTSYGAVDICLTIGTNDLAAGTTPEGVLTNVKTYWAAMKAAGASRLILMGIDPRGGASGADQSKIDSINAAYRHWAASRSDVFYVDTQPYWIDPATAHEPIGGSGASRPAFSVTYDGLHGSGYGMYRKGQAMRRTLLDMYRPRGENILGTGYYDATNPRGNILNMAGTRGNGGSVTGLGRARAIGGAVGDGFTTFTNSGSGTVTGTPPLGWVLGGAINGDMSLTFEVANSAELAAKYGGTWPVVRMTWSGTPSANGNITLVRAITGGAISGNPVMELESLVSFHAMQGLMLLWASGSSSSGSAILGNIGGVTQASSQLPQLDGVHLLHGIAKPASVSNNVNMTQYLYFRSGVAVSGSIDFIYAGIRNIVSVA